VHGEVMSGKLQEVLDRLQKANNTITEQRKEIERLRALALKRITKEWQYLADDEIKEIVGGYGNEGGIGAYTRELFDKIEAKIREKNE
jgi:uncharacterized coiled-coil protein SlyX